VSGVRIDLDRDGLLLCKLERVMNEAVGVAVSVEESVRRAARMREQISIFTARKHVSY